MFPAGNILGIDGGSVSISAAELTPDGRVIQTVVRPHHGDPSGALNLILDSFDLKNIAGIAATYSTPKTIFADSRCDNQVAIIAAAKRFHDRLAAILIIGGEKFGLISFDEHGRYLNYKTNTSCAAGTGSFLDQQARRLGLSGIEQFCEIALENNGDLPKIASRCAVFAKTDLVHAQQEGWTLPAICDGLCRGLARNVIDVLFSGGPPRSPILFTGGVSRNAAVVRHIRDLLGVEILVDDTGAHAAIGAALKLIEDRNLPAPGRFQKPADLIVPQPSRRKAFHPPLKLELSEYPDFFSHRQYNFNPAGSEIMGPVEVDVYQPPCPDSCPEVFLGVDVGSTSTKAALVDPDGSVLAGFYTRTAGRPVKAVQNLLAAIDDLGQSSGANFKFLAAGTTGSGRQLIGRLIGADMIIDEITAHARAAWELNPEVDTIIEIGGQDAKFTTVNNRMVSFSAMNNVCAAGTGSFIEELAERLDCPLAEYAGRTENRRSPIVSDRCTVFMERDINHNLREGFETDEVLASVVHAVRENYLTKVAVESMIGSAVCFQGATAKNRALVAAFEQRLGQPIFVSKFCHLTGALGTALLLAEDPIEKTAFRGLSLHRMDIPIRSEVCDICPNHCKLTLADLAGRTVAYGFLCGRDYDAKKRAADNRSGFDLLKTRRQSFKPASNRPNRTETVLGLPAALYMVEDLALWKKFFDELSIPIVTSERFKEALAVGKRAAGAEFCAPLTSLYGHVAHLLEKADYIFLPRYLERRVKEKDIRRQYCYYTQYAGSLAAEMDPDRIISPMVHYLYPDWRARLELYQALKPVYKNLGFFDVSEAFSRARQFHVESLAVLQDTYRSETENLDDVHVVLLGRPYTVLSEGLNKGIPNAFGRLGVKTFFQDMLEPLDQDRQALAPLLEEVQWHFSAEILKTAQVVGRTPGAYPVFVTSFKCSPDSIIVGYFKRIMATHEKPYLILQLDEHDSSVGYETRIEAGLRSFRNHYAAQSRPIPRPLPPTLKPVTARELADKTLFLPNWDDLCGRLLAANLRRIGLDARLLEPDHASTQIGLRLNTGQCIPLNIIAQEFIDNVTRLDMDPSKAVLWLFASRLSCNLGLFPQQTKTILDAHGRGMEKAGVYVGELSFADISLKLPFGAYFAYMFGGLLRKMACRLRPYEVEKGSVDRAVQAGLPILEEALSGLRPKEEAVARVVEMFEAIEVRLENRPKVAIFGDLYVRDREWMNQDLVRFIEAHGGEVVTTPYHSYLKMIAGPYLRKWLVEGNYLGVLSSEAMLMTLRRLDKTYYKYFQRVLKEPEPEFNESPRKILAEYNVRIENTGESMENILKIFYLLKRHPDLSLFVQTSPAFCCPSLVTEAMSAEIEKKTGVPIVSITYDGTASLKNEVVVPYLTYPRNVLKSPVERDGHIVKAPEGLAPQ